MIQETLEAIEEAKNKTGNADQEVLWGLEEKLKELASPHRQRLMAKQKVHQMIRSGVTEKKSRQKKRQPVKQRMNLKLL